MESSVTPATPELEYFVTQFKDSSLATQEARRRSELARDYYDGKQWTKQEESTLAKRGQPAIVDNQIKDKVDSFLGLERQTRTDPKGYPRNPEDAGAADAATDALRYVADANHFQQTKSAVFANYIVEGTGGAEVIVENSAKGPEIRIRRVRWDRMYWDPHALLEDFSDAEYCGIVVWMDLGKAQKRYPQLAEELGKLMENSSFDAGDTYDDKPIMWVDRKRRRVQIFEHYCKIGGVWHRTVFSRAGFIEEPAPSQYLDDMGQPECPLVYQSAHVARDGRRYGIVDRYIPLQDEVNHRRSKMLHLITHRTIVADKGAVADVQAARKELAKADGYIEANAGMRFEIVQNAEMARGQMELLQQSLMAFAQTGPNSAMLGQESDQSGRAQQVAQQANAVQLGVMFDGLRYWQTRVMRQVWNRIRQFWREEKWIRVTDDEKTAFVGLNRRVTRGEVEAEKLKGLPDDQKVAALQAIMANPESMQEVVLNATQDMDIDIIIDESPDTVTLQQEQWGQLVELAKNGLPIKPETIVKASTLRNKEQLLDDMKADAEQGQGIPPQIAEQIQQVAEQQQQAGEQLAKQEEAVKAQMEQLKAEEARLKELILQIKMERAEVEAARKLQGIEAKVAQANLRATAATSRAQSKGSDSD